MQKKTSKGKIATGLAAASAAAAIGYYFYASTQAKQHRQVVATWAHTMKKDVIREARRLKNITPQEFAKIVDTVASTYEGIRSISAEDLKRAAHELKSNVKMVRDEIQHTSQKDVSYAKAVGKRVLARGKKTVKKIVA